VVSVVYLDTSALVKRYVAEPGSEWVQDLLNYSGPTMPYTWQLRGSRIASSSRQANLRLPSSAPMIVC
jgi:predicted nucleic acid-binding protein